MTLREVLHAHIPKLTTASTVRDAVDRMDIYQFPALVVVDEDDGPVAVVTEGDLVRAASQRDNLTSMAREPASIYGTQDPTTAPPDMEIGEAFHLMRSSGLTILPIADQGRLCGVVFRCDLMQAMFLDSDSANDSR